MAKQKWYKLADGAIVQCTPKELEEMRLTNIVVDQGWDEIIEVKEP
jgi:hypothetical protein